MKKFDAVPKVKIFTLLLGIVFVICPVLIALNQSWRHGQAEEIQKVLDYAKDVQHRTDDTSDQISVGVKRLTDAHLSDPCSANSLAIMRDIDLSSSYIQAIGHVSNGVFECSSLGPQGSGWDLGPVDFVSSRGVIFRLNVQVPFAPDTRFAVVETNSYAAIINKSLPVDITVSESDVSLAAFSQDNHRILTSRGIIKPEWLKELGKDRQKTFFKDGYAVALVTSDRYRTGGMAALPARYIDEQTRGLAIVLVPIGLLTGLLFAAAIFYLARIQTSMPSLLRSALRHNEFFMLYQPIVSLQTEEWVGAEALVRWRRPSGEMIPPDIFIKVAEDTGLIRKITQRVIRLISKDAANVFNKYPGFHLGINLAAADLHSMETITLLNDLISETGAGPKNLIVEATERGFIQADIAKKMISEIRQNNIGIAIDDFGTGYSSLSYLESVEIDYLKIDKSFVDKIGTDAATSQVVLHIISMAKALNLLMIAEGVETEAQAQFLRDQGVQYAQGWLYGKPMLLQDLIRQLRKSDT
jgi:sensor c-di-GMP phosphodiesterase-like protein